MYWMTVWLIVNLHLNIQNQKNQSKHMIVLAVTTDQGNLTNSAKQTRHQ